MALTRGFFHIGGWLYDGILGTMLRKVRRRVAGYVAEEQLFPCLDLCCGTGSQGRAIVREANALDEVNEASEKLYEGVGLGRDRKKFNYQDNAQGDTIKIDPADGNQIEAENGPRENTRQRNDSGGKNREPKMNASRGVIYETTLEVVAGLDRDCGMLRFAVWRAPSLPFICGDAADLPFKSSSFKAVVLSFALHHLAPEERVCLIDEARRVLGPGGKIIFVEFEPAWDRPSRVGALFRDAIEKMAGGDHYRNGREFLARGGLRVFLRENGLEERARHNVWAGAFGVVVAGEKLGTRI